MSVPCGCQLTPSRVLRDVIEAGSGAKRIELDETATTIEQLLGFVTTGDSPLIVSDLTTVDYSQAVRFVLFLKKYDCQPALAWLLKFLKASSNSRSVGILRLLTAANLDLPKTVADLLHYEPELFGFLRPVAHGVLPQELLPYDAFQHIPHRYLWALMAALESDFDMRTSRDRVHLPLPQRFLHIFEGR